MCPTCCMKQAPCWAMLECTSVPLVVFCLKLMNTCSIYSTVHCFAFILSCTQTMIPLFILKSDLAYHLSVWLMGTREQNAILWRSQSHQCWGQGREPKNTHADGDRGSRSTSSWALKLLSMCQVGSLHYFSFLLFVCHPVPFWPLIYDLPASGTCSRLPVRWSPSPLSLSDFTAENSKATVLRFPLTERDMNIYLFERLKSHNCMWVMWIWSYL